MEMTGKYCLSHMEMSEKILTFAHGAVRKIWSFSHGDVEIYCPFFPV